MHQLLTVRSTKYRTLILKLTHQSSLSSQFTKLKHICRYYLWKRKEKRDSENTVRHSLIKFYAFFFSKSDTGHALIIDIQKMFQCQTISKLLHVHLESNFHF